ncbi:MAG: outer membrane beta-barrel protein [Bacteroidota bacterium]|nr:outer membrane beta-barrel protein [Bacteroidota bacterium]
MKKIIFTLFIVTCFVISSYGQFTKVGGSLSYNTGYYFNNERLSDHKTGNPVLSATGIYEISLRLHLKPSINIFMPNIHKDDFIEGSYKRVVSAFSLDIDAHYVFNYLDRFEFYGLAGFNMLYARMKLKEEFVGSEPYTITSNNTALGFNLGAGTYFKMKDEFDLFFELKAIIGKQVQGVVTAGILLNIEWMKEHENREI